MMNKIIALALLISTFSIAQHYNFDKEAEFQLFLDHGGEIEELSPNSFKFTYQNKLSRIFNFDKDENLNQNNNYADTTILNIWEIDTTKFNDMFIYWKKAQVANLWWDPLPIEDLNQNNNFELYGYTDIINPALPGPVKIFEKDLNEKFVNVFTYDSTTTYVKGIADINRSGSPEIITMFIEELDSTIYSYPIYTSDSLNTFPKVLDFFFYFSENQINNMRFGDWDGNGKTNCAFIVGAGARQCIISEYNENINNFEELFRFQSEDGDLSGFAVGDFNQDNKLELVTSSGLGEVYVIQNVSENEYEIINQFSFHDYNAYMHTGTNDIDGNGKPEFWIAGQNFEEGITKVRCYEAVGDNEYNVVAYIELRFLVSLFTQYLQAVDVDDDGREELVFSIGNVLLILKFVGSINEHKYSIMYAKFGEATQIGAQFYPAAFTDLDGDSKKDLVIPMEKYTPTITYAFSYILKQNKPSGIKSTFSNEFDEDLISSYPNPFNSLCTISFVISQTTDASVIIYNTLGKEIKILQEKELSPGNYNILWDATDKYGDSVSSGVYLIVLRLKDTVKTFKSILLK